MKLVAAFFILIAFFLIGASASLPAEEHCPEK